MPKAELQWIDIDDFRPGIHNNALRSVTAPGAAPAPGVADPAGTYRCMATDQGALAPLWTQDFSLEYDELPDGPLTGHDYKISGFYVAQPVQVANSLREHEFFFGIEWIDDTNRKFNLRRYRPFTPDWDTVLATQSSTVLPTVDQYTNTHFITTRSLQSNPLAPGVPVVVISHAALTPTNPSTIWSFPNDASPSVTAVEALFTNQYYPSRLLAHQGRTVLFNEITYGHGAVGGWFTNENVLWTEVNDSDTLSDSQAAIFSPENPAGYAVVASMSANELFAVKRFGGGLTINGDLDDPIVVSLPSVPSGISCIPAITPLGVVYLGSNGGVYAWRGGDTAEPIGRQLEDFTWMVENCVLLDYKAVLTPVGTDYVVLPRGFVYNIHTKSWWRIDNLDNQEDGLEDAPVFPTHLWNFQQGFSNNQSPFVYGAVLDFNTDEDSDEPQPIVFGWDTATPAHSYSWKSHPLWALRNKRATVRQIIVEAIGIGDVQIIVLGGFPEFQVVNFPIANETYPDKIRRDISVRGEAISIIVTSKGQIASDPAPVIYAIRIGFDEGQHVEAAPSA